MNSEKNNSTKRELENKLKNLRNKKMIDLSSILGLDYNNNYDFINSFLKQIISVLGIESMEKHIEAIDFIISNNPKDTIETFHLLHLFLLKELNIKMFQHMKNTQYISHLQDFAKLVIKSSSAFSSGMINLKTYRTGINITKNFQSNTLNQTYIANSPQNQIEEKREIKEVVRSDEKINKKINKHKA